jgi:hypothetical protein
MLLHIRSKATVLLLLIAFLTACTSPRERSQALAAEILGQLPVPDDAALLYSSEFESISSTGMGTGFGVRGLYGSDTEYSLVVEQYRDLLSAQGWVQFTPITEDTLWFCNPDYEGIRLELANTAGLGDEIFAIPADILREHRATHQTLYVVTVAHFPFDETGICK